jgi:hypothetical protein
LKRCWNAHAPNASQTNASKNNMPPQEAACAN